MEPHGPKIAEGRDAEIFEHGPGRVLRVTRHTRSLVMEAEVMRHVRAQGYPAPEVFDAGDGWILMERLDGGDMISAMRRTPRGLRDAGAQLADLHTSLAAIPAPATLEAAPGPTGDRVVHLDLHPLNVMATAHGLVVIDWSNARRGDPGADVANTWALLAAGQLQGSWRDRAIAKVGRGLLLRTFLSHLDRDAARAALPAIVEWRHHDSNMSEAELAKMRALLP